MRVAIYARISTESQVEVLLKRVAEEGHELVAEYCDDGCSGAKLDRPGLDALRDASEAGQLDAVWCLSPDRLARMYAYQVIVVDELARRGVAVLFHDTPPPADDPQTQLLTQVQGVIAEYERTKIAERYRRGKLWRARAGEAIAWKCSYGYRRIARCADRPAHLEVYEPEAAIVRRIFRDYVENNLSMRPRPDQAGVAEHHREQPDDALDPRLVGELDLETGEVDLRLLSRRRLEARFVSSNPSGSDLATRLKDAIKLARSQAAKSLELRATTSLARLWRAQGKCTEAHDLLASVYCSFTEGFDTLDLKEAKALLSIC
jgi:DNA invertase Pin-like site-specific DNA recombinase